MKRRIADSERQPAYRAEAERSEAEEPAVISHPVKSGRIEGAGEFFDAQRPGVSERHV